MSDKNDENSTLEEEVSEAPIIIEEPKTSKKKSKAALEPVAELIPVKLLTKAPDESGYYRVRDVSGGSERIIYRVKADKYPFSYATQYMNPNDLERVL